MKKVPQYLLRVTTNKDKKGKAIPPKEVKAIHSKIFTIKTKTVSVKVKDKRFSSGYRIEKKRKQIKIPYGYKTVRDFGNVKKETIVYYEKLDLA